MQANERTARVLLVFAGEEDALGVTEIARRLGLGKSTVHRALEGLVASGIVMRDPASSLYRLGPRAIELGLRAIGAADIRALALPFMFDLRDSTGETVTLSLRIGNERTFLTQMRSRQEVRMLVNVGTRLPLHAGAPGRVILAHFTETELASYLAAVPLVPVTEATVTDEAALRALLVHSHDVGYAVSRGERNCSASAVAAPIYARGAVIGSIAICGPHDRFDSTSVDRYAEAVVEAGRAISGRMG
jgi:IclR family acetate operon transcriptional repressor